ncbi:MAG: 50S ribosomal protein L18, partial [Gammaproteobacteria bacterium]|nr:50S ribosomal protein L18 [Gammaproteobacteria bacterium]
MAGLQASRKASRLRRAKRTRMKIRELNVLRLTVHRTPRHIYAQVIEGERGRDRVLVQASTLDKSLRNGAAGVAPGAGGGGLRAPRGDPARVHNQGVGPAGDNYHRGG